MDEVWLSHFSLASVTASDWVALVAVVVGRASALAGA
jgi:hypothetical protein